MLFNFALVTSITAMVIAQIIKVPLNYFINKELNFQMLISTGGMPSSHSAFVTALAISIGLEEGIHTNSFAIAFVLAGVVIHDALGVRREAGKHATVLNKISEDISVIIDGMKNNIEDKHVLYQRKLKELLGHEPTEAIGGVILGIIVAAISYLLYINF